MSVLLPRRRMFWEHLETWGFVFIGLACFTTYALILKGHDTGALGASTRAIHWAFGRLCWLVPSITAIMGVIFVAEASDPRIVAPLTLGSATQVLLLSIIFGEGHVGLGFWQTLYAITGKATFPVVAACLMILMVGMAGISARACLKATMAYLRASDVRRSQAVAVKQDAKPRVVGSSCADLIEETSVVEIAHKGAYRLPALSLFREPVTIDVPPSNDQVKLVSSLKSLGVNVSYQGQERGPSVTSYRIKPALGTKVSKITALRDDIQIALSAQSVRIEAPIPGKDVVGIEVPNAVRDEVFLRDMLDGLDKRGALPIVIGRDMSGKSVIVDLASMPHMLVAGATGSGKSVFLNVLIASLLSHLTPSDLHLVMIDPKRTELTPYNGIPHLGSAKVIVDLQQAAGALQRVKRDMESRLDMLSRAGVRKIAEYNAKHPDAKMPYLVVIIDEMAELMLTVGDEIEKTIISIAQLGRAAGVHLVLATQKPLAEVVTSLIKSNLPCRVAFAVASQVDSRTILDMNGAETLLGRGDMLFLPEDAPKPRRIQSANVTSDELSALVDHWREQAGPEHAQLIDEPEPVALTLETSIDERAYEAALFMLDTRRVSTIGLRKQLGVGHPRAADIMNQLAELGVVSGHAGSKSRRLLIESREDLDQIFGRENMEVA